MQVEIRRIRADEGLRLRAIRLHALADAPMAFGSTLAREAAFADDVWHARASGSALGSERVTFVAERDRDWIGMATGLAADPDGDAGPVLVAMFVAPEARRAHVGVSLVEAVTAWAQTRGDQHLRLWVTDSNRAAIAPYQRCGFRATGRSRPLAHTPAVDELEMARDLGWRVGTTDVRAGPPDTFVSAPRRDGPAGRRGYGQGP
jgi:GNAT superfamily N-acetyltransferase